jgi:hypothetical protein
MTIQDMARIALAILWGSALCGSGFLAAAALVSREDGDRATVAFLSFQFGFAVLVTLGAAGLFDSMDWFAGRSP